MDWNEVFHQRRSNNEHLAETTCSGSSRNSWGTCGLSAKALGHVITLRFNKYSFTINIMCNVHINMLHTQHHTGYRPVLVTGKPKQLLVVFLQLQNYWYSTNISSSSLAKSLPALSPSPVCATMSNRPSSFFTWLRLIWNYDKTCSHPNVGSPSRESPWEFRETSITHNL